MRRDAKVDANQPEIVKDLRAIGCSVLHLHMIGKGAGDILVGYRGNNWLFEIKDGNKPPSGRKLTPDEVVFHETWRGQITTIKSSEEAINIVTGYDYTADLPPF